jgi:hypothetical protein
VKVVLSFTMAHVLFWAFVDTTVYDVTEPFLMPSALLADMHGPRSMENGIPTPSAMVPSPSLTSASCCSSTAESFDSSNPTSVILPQALIQIPKLVDPVLSRSRVSEWNHLAGTHIVEPLDLLATVVCACACSDLNSTSKCANDCRDGCPCCMTTSTPLPGSSILPSGLLTVATNCTNVCGPPSCCLPIDDNFTPSGSATLQNCCSGSSNELKTSLPITPYSFYAPQEMAALSMATLSDFSSDSFWEGIENSSLLNHGLSALQMKELDRNYQ